MKNKFTKAIVRKPAKSLINGITTAKLGPPDYQLACNQHIAYIEALKTAELDVTVLEADEAFPDSCFVEDVALCTPKCAIVTQPGAASRAGEIKPMTDVLKAFYDTIEHITLPGTVEAGDIMMVGDHYYIGISERTNTQGAEQMIKLLHKFELSGSKVSLKEVLHLKTGLAYLENNNLLVCGEFTEKEAFHNFNKIIIPAKEAYAANCIWVNDFVVMPAGFPKTKALIASLGYKVLDVELSEFEKLDGGASCLSLRF